MGTDAVEKATGRPLEAWLEVLDAWGAVEKGHAATACHLEEVHGLSPWWSQEVTVRYERARGLRVVGETQGGFQVGVRRTLDLLPEEAWQRITEGSGLRQWLGDGAPARLVPGERFTLPDGTTGQVRVVQEGSHVRLTFQPPGWARPSTIQVRVLLAAGGRTTLSFHQERLPDAEAREAMGARWRGVLEAWAGV